MFRTSRCGGDSAGIADDGSRIGPQKIMDWTTLEHGWWRIALEIILLAVGIYYVLMFVRGTRGGGAVSGFLCC